MKGFLGKAANDPTLLADTMLDIMINNLHGGPTFINKLIPVTKMTAYYLYDTVDLSARRIEEVGGIVEAIICNGN